MYAGVCTDEKAGTIIRGTEAVGFFCIPAGMCVRAWWLWAGNGAAWQWHCIFCRDPIFFACTNVEGEVGPNALDALRDGIAGALARVSMNTACRVCDAISVFIYK